MSAATIKVSELYGYRRIDAEFYQPHYERNEALISRFPATKKLGEITTKFFKGIFDINADEYVAEGVPFVRINNLRNGIIDESDIAFISPERHRQEVKTALRRYDLALSKTAYPAASLVQIEACNVSQDIIAVGTNLSEDFNFYLVAYLNTRFGLLQMKRLFQGNVQMHLSLPDAKTITIPIPSAAFQSKIRRIFEQSFRKREEARQDYAQAQSLLAAELGLDRLDLPREDIAIRRLSEIAPVNRIDAEYYHPQKAYVQRWLDKLPGKAISAHFNPIREIYNPPKADTGKSILNFDLTDALRYFVDENGPMMPENEIGSMKKRMKNGDVVVSRLRSYLREIALVEVPKGRECVGSSEFVVVRPKSAEVCPEVLVVYLRSAPAQIILKWSQDGSNHPRFQEEELLAIKLPDRVIKLQGKLRKLVRSGIEAHRDAQRLLAEAKAEVERMIEGK